MNKEEFVTTLNQELCKGITKPMDESNIDNISSNITECLNKALEASSKLVPVVPATKHKMPKEVLAINEKIRRKEKEKSVIIKNLKGRGPYPSCTTREVKELEEVIGKLQCEKTRLLKDSVKENHRKIKKIINKKGTNSTTFWRVVKEAESQNITSVQKKDGGQTSDQNKTLAEAVDYFKDLFKDRQMPEFQRDPNHQTHKNMGSTKPLTQAIKMKDVRNTIKSLKSAKQPDQI